MSKQDKLLGSNPVHTNHTSSIHTAQTVSTDWLINAQNIIKTYRRGANSVQALRGANLQVAAGDFVVILGPSGSGKSTLLHILGGIDRPTAGQVRVAGLDLHRASERVLTRFRRETIGFVFQFYNLLPALSALDNVCLPLLARGRSWPAARQHGRGLLAQVGLTARLEHKPGELSGGEQQRVAIARALAGEPAVILADEPTGDLDSATSAEVIALLHELNQRLGLTFIVATHNQALTKSATHCYQMQDGRLNGHT